MIREYNYLFKMVLIGNSSVGKSSILRRFADDTFQESYLATIGVDFRFKSITVQGDIVKIQIWDTAGQERFRTITGTYYKGAHAIILVYDITRQQTYQDIEEFWLGEIDKHADSNVKLCILGNKMDEEDKRKIQTSQAEQWCKNKGIIFREVSAKTGEGVSEAFQTLSQELTKIHPKQDRKQDKNPVIEDIQRKKKEFQLQSAATSSKKKDKCCNL